MLSLLTGPKSDRWCGAPYDRAATERLDYLRGVPFLFVAVIL
jgi:hypothetical protein